jgi:peptidoglycan/LPS O-acetylase OafA/YrhL
MMVLAAGVLPRLHGLDALRAAMMLLGLVLHAGASFTVLPLQAWSYKADRTSLAFDVTLLVIHLFRMPAFFAMAGFFGAMLYRRRGWRGLVHNRLARIAAPLAVAWALLFPIWATGFDFAMTGGDARSRWARLADGQLVVPVGLMHLWFLYYLLFFYGAAVAIARLAPRVAIALDSVPPQSPRWVASVPGVTALGALTALLLSRMAFPGIETDDSFAPALRVVTVYGLFFAAGWWLFEHQAALPTLARRAWPLLGCAAAGSLLYAALLLTPMRRFSPAHAVTLLTTGIVIWCWVLGLVGFFLRYCSAPSAWRRYVADAAYWVYLVHVVVILWTVGALAPLGLRARWQFLIALGVGTAVSFLTYHYGVRTTVIGRWLNGRRAGRPPLPDSQVA